MLIPHPVIMTEARFEVNKGNYLIKLTGSFTCSAIDAAALVGDKEC